MQRAAVFDLKLEPKDCLFAQGKSCVSQRLSLAVVFVSPNCEIGGLRCYARSVMVEESILGLVVPLVDDDDVVS